MKKVLILIVSLFSVSCSTKNPDKDFMNLVYREKAMQKIETKRTFNPSSAMLISTTPNNLGNFKRYGKVNDFETFKNGFGYSTRYKNKKLKNSYWIDFFAYNLGKEKISENIFSLENTKVYNLTKNEIIKSPINPKLIEENIVSFKGVNGNIVEMREAIFNYYDPIKKVGMISYLYFGTAINSFYKVRINHENNNLETSIKEKELFIRDLGYYYSEGMSLGEFEKYKKSNIPNPVSIETRKIITK